MWVKNKLVRFSTISTFAGIIPSSVSHWIRSTVPISQHTSIWYPIQAVSTHLCIFWQINKLSHNSTFKKGAFFTYGLHSLNYPDLILTPTRPLSFTLFPVALSIPFPSLLLLILVGYNQQCNVCCCNTDKQCQNYRQNPGKHWITAAKHNCNYQCRKSQNKIDPFHTF